MSVDEENVMYPSADSEQQQRQQEKKFQILTETNAAGGPLRVAEARYEKEGGEGAEKRQEEEEKVMQEPFFFSFSPLTTPLQLLGTGSQITVGSPWGET